MTVEKEKMLDKRPLKWYYSRATFYSACLWFVLRLWAESTGLFAPPSELTLLAFVGAVQSALAINEITRHSMPRKKED